VQIVRWQREVLVHLGDADEPVTVREPWAKEEFVSYEIRWINAEPRARAAYPSEPFLPRGPGLSRW